MNTVYVYRAKNNEWAWHVKNDGNHEIVADSGETYKNGVDAVEMAQGLFPDTPMVIEDGK